MAQGGITEETRCSLTNFDRYRSSRTLPTVSKRVAERLQEVEVDLGTVLARQGDFAYHLFVVGGDGRGHHRRRAGHVARPGSTFGEIGVLDHGVRTANVVAATPMRLLTMMVDFDELAADLPEFAAHAKTMAQYRLERS